MINCDLVCNLRIIVLAFIAVVVIVLGNMTVIVVSVLIGLVVGAARIISLEDLLVSRPQSFGVLSSDSSVVVCEGSFEVAVAWMR